MKITTRIHKKITEILHITDGIPASVPIRYYTKLSYVHELSLVVVCFLFAIKAFAANSRIVEYVMLSISVGLLWRFICDKKRSDSGLYYIEFLEDGININTWKTKGILYIPWGNLKVIEMCRDKRMLIIVQYITADNNVDSVQLEKRFFSNLDNIDVAMILKNKAPNARTSMLEKYVWPANQE